MDGQQLDKPAADIDQQQVDQVRENKLEIERVVSSLVISDEIDKQSNHAHSTCRKDASTSANPFHNIVQRSRLIDYARVTSPTPSILTLEGQEERVTHPKKRIKGIIKLESEVSTLDKLLPTSSIHRDANTAENQISNITKMVSFVDFQDVHMVAAEASNNEQAAHVPDAVPEAEGPAPEPAEVNAVNQPLVQGPPNRPTLHFWLHPLTQQGI
jgi:hypothetical protein